MEVPEPVGLAELFPGKLTGFYRLPCRPACSSCQVLCKKMKKVTALCCCAKRSGGAGLCVRQAAREESADTEEPGCFWTWQLLCVLHTCVLTCSSPDLSAAAVLSSTGTVSLQSRPAGLVEAVCREGSKARPKKLTNWR